MDCPSSARQLRDRRFCSTVEMLVVAAQLHGGGPHPPVRPRPHKASISGYGLAAVVFALIGIFPFGWRGLYALALLPLALIIPLRRILPESKRFEREDEARIRPTSVMRPLGALFETYPGRLAAVLAVAFLNAAGMSAAGFFVPKYLQEAHQWSPGQVCRYTSSAGRSESSAISWPVARATALGGVRWERFSC